MHCPDTRHGRARGRSVGRLVNRRSYRLRKNLSPCKALPFQTRRLCTLPVGGERGGQSDSNEMNLCKWQIWCWTKVGQSKEGNLEREGGTESRRERGRFPFCSYLRLSSSQFAHGGSACPWKCHHSPYHTPLPPSPTLSSILFSTFMRLLKYDVLYDMDFIPFRRPD